MRNDSPVLGAGGWAVAAPAPASVSALTVPTVMKHVARLRRLLVAMVLASVVYFARAEADPRPGLA
jgi:hypothetical protein